MPAVSQKQYALFQAVAHGGVKLPGMSADQAKEYVSGQSPKGLPKYSKLKKKLKPHAQS